MKDRDNNVVYAKSFAFAVQIVELHKEMSNANKAMLDLFRQLLRSGTSVGANVREALEAQSKKDFIAKMHIALKEGAESAYWIELLNATGFIPNEKAQLLKSQIDEMIRILNSIIKTTKLSLHDV